MVSAQQPKLLVLVGMIASGKSTFCAHAAKSGIICVNDDAIVSLVHGGNYTLYNNGLKLLYKSVENHIIATSLAIGHTVIIDRGLNISLEGRRRLLVLAKSYDVASEAICLANEGPAIHAARRFNSDPRGLSLEYWQRVAERHNQLYTTPTLAEGFDVVRHVSYDEIEHFSIQ